MQSLIMEQSLELAFMLPALSITQSKTSVLERLTFQYLHSTHAL